MIVFSLFEFILGIKRYSFLGFYYNHWYDKWIKSWSSRLSQSPFFLLVGLGHAISSLARPLRHLRLLWRYPPWDFFLHPGACYAGCFGDCSALSRTFEGSTWSKSIVSQTLHWSYSGFGLHSRFITAEESNFQTVLFFFFHKRERTFAISCSW